MPHSALETVEVLHERSKTPKQVRITRNVRRAIQFMVHEGMRRPEAAKAAGIHDETMRRALTQRHILAYLNHEKGVLRTSAQARTIAIVEQLMESAESEHIRLEAVKYLEPPVSKSEITHTHQGHIPGLTIVFAGPSQPALLIDDQPHGLGEANAINALPQPVPHGSAGNAIPEGARVPSGGAAGRGGRGQK